MLMIGRINIVKIAMLPKAIYGFNPIPIKIPTEFFKNMKRAILNFMWKNEKPKILKTILNNKRTSGSIIIHDLKLYYRKIVIRTTRYWYRDRKVNLWNRIEDVEIKPYIYGHLISDKPKPSSGKMTAYSTNSPGSSDCWQV